MWAIIKVEMSGRKLQVALLAGILILANAQCLFACAAEPCDPAASPASSDHPIPPCHKQNQPSKQDKAPPSCAHAPLVAEYRARATVDADLTLATRLIDAVSPHSVSLSDPGTTEATVVEHATSPPSPELDLSTVLRV